MEIGRYVLGSLVKKISERKLVTFFEDEWDVGLLF